MRERDACCPVMVNRITSNGKFFSGVGVRGGEGGVKIQTPRLSVTPEDTDIKDG
jgi:hypothetical protein